MTDTPELLPCPFCGTDELSHGWAAPGFRGGYSDGHAECMECGVLVIAATEQDAIAAWNRRTPAPVSDNLREVVARALFANDRKYARTAWEGLIEGQLKSMFLSDADAALTALTPHIAAEIAAAVAKERAGIEADLADPQIVHMNMLRGGIAKINVTQAMHLNGWTSIDNWHRMTVEQIEAAVKARNEHGAKP